MPHAESLTLQWSPVYHPEWDATAAAYLEAGIVQWGRSRRLARGEDPACAFKAYLGVHHSAWGDAETTRFFLSLFVARRTIALRTFPTFGEALAELHIFHGRLVAGTG